MPLSTCWSVTASQTLHWQVNILPYFRYCTSVYMSISNTVPECASFVCSMHCLFNAKKCTVDNVVSLLLLASSLLSPCINFHISYIVWNKDPYAAICHLGPYGSCNLLYAQHSPLHLYPLIISAWYSSSSPTLVSAFNYSSFIHLLLYSQSCCTAAMMAEVLSSACAGTSVSQLSALLSLRRNLLVSQEERPSSMLKGVEDSLNRLSKVPGHKAPTLMIYGCCHTQLSKFPWWGTQYWCCYSLYSESTVGIPSHTVQCSCKHTSF